MFIKKKHITVIVLSSIIVAAVFISTLIMYNLYAQWKKDSFDLKYRSSIYKMTAELFREDVEISNITVKVGNGGVFSGIPLLTGSLKNNFNKTITSILVEISFSRPDGTVVYKDWFHPMVEQQLVGPVLFHSTEQTRNVLLPGEGVSFRHLLKNCPHEIVEQLAFRSDFAKSNLKDRVKMECSIIGMSVL